MKPSSSFGKRNELSSEASSAGKASEVLPMRIVDAFRLGINVERNELRAGPQHGEQSVLSPQRSTYHGFRPRPVNPCQAPDSFFEGECDVGPRAILSPLHIDCSSRPSPNPSVVQAILWFNKGISHHSGGDHESASDSYCYALDALSKDPLPSSSDTDTLTSCLTHIKTLIHNNLGQIDYLDCDEARSLSHFRSALELSKEVVHVADESLWMLTIATLASNMARTLWMIGDFHSADLEINLREVLRLRSFSLPPEHPDVACANLNVGFLLFRSKDKQNAKIHFLEYLKQARQHPVILDPIPAMVHLLMIDCEGREDHMSKYLELTAHQLLETRSNIGDVNGNMATLLNNLGTVLFNLGQLEDSLFFYTHELELQKKLSVNVDCIHKCVTLNNIGRILQELGRLTEAIEFYEQALETHPSVNLINPTFASYIHPQDSVPIASENDQQPTLHLFSTIWYNLGIIHDRKGSRSDAISAFKMSLKLRQRMYGQEHQDVACLWYNIGTLQMENNQIDDATQSLQEAIRIKIMGYFQEDPVKLARTLSKLACLQEDRGRIVEAFVIRGDILQLQTAGDDCFALGETLLKMSELRFALGKTEEALDLAQQSLDATFSSDSASYEHLHHNKEGFATVAKTLIMIGSLHHERAEIDMARETFRKAQAVLERGIRYHSGEASQLDSLLAGLRLLEDSSCAAEA